MKHKIKATECNTLHLEIARLLAGDDFESPEWCPVVDGVRVGSISSGGRYGGPPIFLAIQLRTTSYPATIRRVTIADDGTVDIDQLKAKHAKLLEIIKANEARGREEREKREMVYKKREALADELDLAEAKLTGYPGRWEMCLTGLSKAEVLAVGKLIKGMRAAVKEGACPEEKS